MSNTRLAQRKTLKRVGVALVVALLLFFSNLAAPSNAAARLDGAPVIESLTEALGIIEGNYAGEVDYNRAVDATINGMLHMLDPHSNFYSKEEFTELRTQQQSEYFGIGATVTQRQNKVFILAPFENTPAARAGLHYGDHIVSINGQPTEGWNSQKVSSELKGPRGTQVVVGVARPGEAKPLEFTISRDAVSLPSITNAYMVKPGIGYIALRRQFARTSGEEMQEAVKKLKAQGMNQLLLDLRENPGGLVQAALDVCDMFLSRGQSILTIKARRGAANERSFEARNPNPDNYPIVVLVNGNSASASEIVAGALQDHDRAVVVGEVTFGKGLVQTIFPVSDGAGLTLTTAKYYTPSGRLIQRDYSGVSRYNYYLHRDPNGKNGNGTPEPDANRPEFKTDAGRKVYGGGGITPDVIVKGQRFTTTQLRLQEPIFLFVRQLINNQIPGISEYKINDMNFSHVLTPQEFVVTDKVLDAFKEFLAKNPGDYRFPATVVAENAEFLKLALRHEVVTAAYGSEIAQQVYIESDPQVQKSIAEFERAKQLVPKK